MAAVILVDRHRSSCCRFLVGRRLAAGFVLLAPSRGAAPERARRRRPRMRRTVPSRGRARDRRRPRSRRGAPPGARGRRREAAAPRPARPDTRRVLRRVHRHARPQDRRRRRGTTSKRRCCSPTSASPTTQRCSTRCATAPRTKASPTPTRSSGCCATKSSSSSPTAPDRALHLVPGEPNVWMFVGVNGVGKTTTIGKLARAAGRRRPPGGARRGRHVPRRGGRAARSCGPSAPAARSCAARRAPIRARWSSTRWRGRRAASADLVLVDTAGRLHTKVNLMEELKKLRRIVDRTDGRAARRCCS